MCFCSCYYYVDGKDYWDINAERVGLVQVVIGVESGEVKRGLIKMEEIKLWV